MTPAIWTPEPKSVIPPGLRHPIPPGERGYEEAMRLMRIGTPGSMTGGMGGLMSGTETQLLGSNGPPTPPIAGYTLYTFGGFGTFQSNAGTTPATSNGDVVGYWTDYSGSGNHLKSAADDNTRPTLQTSLQNSQSGIRFDGSNDVLAALPGTASPYTIFTVFQRKDVGTGASSIWGQGTNRPTHYNWPALNLVGLVATNTNEADTGAFDVKSGFVVSGCRLKSADNYEKLERAGAVSVTATCVGAPVTLTTFNISKSADGSIGQNDFLSVLVYPSGLSNADMDTIIGWYGSAPVFNIF